MSQPIRFFNRYTQQLETESVYGESYLRWTYENPFGRLSLNLLVKRSLFSAWYGWRMDRPSSKARIAPFIDRYGINMGECRSEADRFETFNDFFYRELNDEARPIVSDSRSICLPADGRHLAIPDLSNVERVYVKGQSFDLGSFLGEESLAERFQGGSMVISRLCPVDYHRFHSPVEGQLREFRSVNGPLYSVSPIALRRNVGFLWENKRELAVIDTEDIGRVAFVAIGATCVGRIRMTRSPGDSIAKGEEMGYFAFGGSCVATIFERNAVCLEDDLIEHSARELEVYARMGDRLGCVR